MGSLYGPKMLKGILLQTDKYLLLSILLSPLNSLPADCGRTGTTSGLD